MRPGRWGRLPQADLWLHGASAGDVRALQPLIAALTARWPKATALLTTQTRTGAEMAQRLCPALPHRAAPLDLPWIASRAVAAAAPRILILEYLELWPRQIAACHRAGVPVVVVDGRISHRSLRVAPLLRRAAGRLTALCARTEGDAERARRLGVPAERVFVCGNGKYDALQAPPTPSPDLIEALRPEGGPPDVCLGSLHRAEFAPALRALSATGLRAVIAPRYPAETPHLLKLAADLGVGMTRRSTGGGGRWIALDTIGELAAAYALAPVAIVGGTLCRRGGQNLVEPAAQGAQVIHGPAVENVALEAEILRGRGGWRAESWEAACALAVARLSAGGPDPRAALADLAGATARHVARIAEILDGGR